MGNWPEKQNGTRKLVDLQGQCPQTEWFILAFRKLNRRGRKPAQMNREFLTELRCRKKVHRGWRQGQVTWEDHRDIVCVCWLADQKAKVELELLLTKDDKRKKTSL